MDFLVEFEINVPDGTPESEVENREHAEASVAAKLVDEGHLLRVWKRPVAPGEQCAPKGAPHMPCRLVIQTPKQPKTGATR